MLLMSKCSLAALLLLLPLACSSNKLRGEKGVSAAETRMLHEVKTTNAAVEVKAIYDSEVKANDDNEVKANDDNEEVKANDHTGSKKAKEHSDSEDDSAGDAETTLPRACSAYTACNGKLPGDCCPTVENVFLGCCYGEVPGPGQAVPSPSSPAASPTISAATKSPTRQEIIADECASNSFCAASGLTGMCCPTTDGRMLGKRERERSSLGP
jgi:hypothetical protein